MRLFPRILAVLLFLSAVVALPVSAEEMVRSFHSDIEVREDGTMTVTENIRVKAEGQEIRHGIYRDFPTRYRDDKRNNYNVDFELVRVLRDNLPEPYHMKDQGNGVRIYIGDADTMIPPGDYTYTLTYTTNRQLGFFKDTDELYWNVTGNGWGWPIEEATAEVHLPGRAAFESLSLDGYTGLEGLSEKNFTSAHDLYTGDITFQTTKPLAPREGLTIVVSWPKGYVTEPTAAMKRAWFLRDNRGLVIGFFGLLGILGYYLLVWAWFGRDPAKGTIIPLFTPPSGFTPADVRHIMRMGYDNKVFTAAVLNMAVKGFLTIEEEKGPLTGQVYTLRRTGAGEDVLSAEGRAISRQLFSSGDSLQLISTNHARVGGAVKALRDFLRTHYEAKYFLTNIQYFIPGLLGSVAVVFIMNAQQSGERLAVALFISVWLSFWSIGVTAMVWEVLRKWGAVFTGGGNDVIQLGSAIFLTVFALPFIGGEVFGIGVFIWATSPAHLPMLAAIAGVNLLFFHLLKAPTLAGRKIMDQMEGFKMYLTVAEKDRMNLLNPPEETPELFEKYLPYALALDVEQRWSERFAGVLARAAQGGQTYRPGWYHGTSLSSLGAGGFAAGLGSSLSSAIASSSTAPGSSSGGGGGGSSGGGGGGGGGGGW